MTTVPPTEAAIPPEDPALRFIRLELAPSPQRWIAALGFTGLALIGVLATVTFRIPYPVLVFAGILLLTVPPTHRPFHQAVEVTGAAFLGAGFAILLAVTTYDQPWLYLPLQCAASGGAAGAFPHHCCAGGLHPGRAGPVLCRARLPARPGGSNPSRAVQCARPCRYGMGGRGGPSSVRTAGDPRRGTRASRTRRIGRLRDAGADRDRPANAVLQHDQSARDPHRGHRRPAHCRPGSAGGLAEDAAAPALRCGLRRARLSDDRGRRAV